MFFTLLLNSVQASYQLRKVGISPWMFFQILPSMAGWQLGLGDGNGWLIDSDVKDCLLQEA